jgi:osmoprotectant transport system ATP-binding protein
VIRLQGVSKIFGGPDGGEVHAVVDLDLEVDAGETICLIGKSGCGKTTTLELINRLAEPSAGRVLVDGRDVRGVDPIRLRRGIGYVIQSGGLFPHLDVARNIGLLCELEGWSRARIQSRVEALLELVDLAAEDGIGRRHPGELSGGQRQRVGIARALALDPPILLLDEPFGALDPVTRGQLRVEFRQLEQRVRKTMVLVTHDLPEAFALGDRIVLMDGGRIVQVGTEADFVERPAGAFVQAFVADHAAAAGVGEDRGRR